MYKIIWTEDKKRRAINMLTEYFQLYGKGESIMQGDQALLDAPELLADIADDILEDEGFQYIEE